MLAWLTNNFITIIKNYGSVDETLVKFSVIE